MLRVRRPMTRANLQTWYIYWSGKVPNMRKSSFLLPQFTTRRCLWVVNGNARRTQSRKQTTKQASKQASKPVSKRYVGHVWSELLKSHLEPTTRCCYFVISRLCCIISSPQRYEPRLYGFSQGQLLCNDVLEPRVGLPPECRVALYVGTD